MKYLVVNLLIFFSVAAMAQIQVGPRVSLGTTFTDIETTKDNVSSGDADFAFGLGLFTAFDLGKVKIMPEVLYESASTNINFKDGDGVQQVAESDLNKIDVPVTLLIEPVEFLSLQGGLIGSYIVSTDDGLRSKTDEAIRNYKDFTFGYQAGVGVSLGSILVDVRYEGPLTKSAENNDNVLGLTFDERQQFVRALIGFNLF